LKTAAIASPSKARDHEDGNIASLRGDRASRARRRIRRCRADRCRAGRRRRRCGRGAPAFLAVFGLAEVIASVFGDEASAGTVDRIVVDQTPCRRRPSCRQVRELGARPCRSPLIPLRAGPVPRARRQVAGDRGELDAAAHVGESPGPDGQAAWRREADVDVAADGRSTAQPCSAESAPPFPDPAERRRLIVTQLCVSRARCRGVRRCLVKSLDRASNPFR
jgi:hypothetical protein